MNFIIERGNGKDNHKISKRFRAANIMLFIFATAIITVITVTVLSNIANETSKDYARLYSTNTSAALSAHLNKESALVEKAAKCEDIINWFSDEYDEKKKAAALSEMIEIIDVLDSDNIYLAIGDSLNEYTVDESSTLDSLTSHSSLTPDRYNDAWYFKCLNSPDPYILNVDVDKILNRKRVWIDYKVMRDGVPIGVICSGLEFANTVENLFSGYDEKKVRGIIIDENGAVQMDSASLGDDNFLRYDKDYLLTDEFNDPIFLKALADHLASIDGLFESHEATVIKLFGGTYSYATIAPIEETNWSVITFYNSSSLYRVTRLIPLLVSMVVILIAYAFVSSAISYRLLFKPIDLLIDSLAKASGNKDEPIYGASRDDEVGSLSRAVKDMLGKVHYDALTGIYNRRFIDENLDIIIKSMSRSGGMFSALMIDIDYFKKYNDTYGHGKGDECLKAVAGALSCGAQRTDDFVARYGGEEFVVILPYTDEEGAKTISARLLKSIMELEIPHEKNEAASCVTISIGVTTGKAAHSQTGEDYLARADEALYMSKQNGRNQYTFLKMESN